MAQVLSITLEGRVNGEFHPSGVPISVSEGVQFTITSETYSEAQVEAIGYQLTGSAYNANPPCIMISRTKT